MPPNPYRRQPNINDMMYPKGSRQPRQVWAAVMNVYKEPESDVVVTPTPTPSNTPTGTPTGTPTNTPTRTPNVTPTNTNTQTPTTTKTPTPTRTPTATLVTACRRYSMYGGNSGGSVIIGNVGTAAATSCGSGSQTFNLSAFQTVVRCGTSANILSGTATVTDTGNCP